MNVRRGGCDDGGGLGDGGGGVRGDHGRDDRRQNSGGKTSDLFSTCVKPNQIVVDSIHKHKLHCKQKLLLESNATWQADKTGSSAVLPFLTIAILGDV